MLNYQLDGCRNALNKVLIFLLNYYFFLIIFSYIYIKNNIFQLLYIIFDLKK